MTYAFPGTCPVATCVRDRHSGGYHRDETGRHFQLAKEPRKPLRARADRYAPDSSRAGGVAPNKEYRDWVKTLPCVAADMPNAGRCSPIVEAHHAGEKGKGQTAPDETCIPLCSAHHKFRGWHSGQGPFRGWTKAERRDWARARIIETQSLWHVEHPGRPVLPPVGVVAP